jgi:glycolate oxidase FAD binding subunit
VADRIRRAEDGADLVVRMSAPPGDLAELLPLARTLGRLRGGRDELEAQPVRLAADVPAGVLRIAVPRVRTDTGWDERWADRLHDLRRMVELRGGGLTVSHAPPQITQRVGAWGDAGAAKALMKRIKESFDPAGILSPGRFVV